MNDIFRKLRKKSHKNERDSIYSMVSCSDLTPGSLEVWQDLPEEIKYDPQLASFRRRYEEHHGKLETHSPEDHETSTQKSFTKYIGHDDNADTSHSDDLTKDSGIRLMQPVDGDEEIKSAQKKRLDGVFRILKLGILVSLWMLLTVSLLLNREKTDVVLHTAVSGSQIKEYHLPSTSNPFSLLVTLTGPFAQSSNSSMDTLLFVWLSRNNLDLSGIEQNSSIWKIHLQPPDRIDFSESVTESRTLLLDILSMNSSVEASSMNMSQLETNVTLRMYSSADVTVPLTISYQLNPLSEKDGIIYASLLLCSLYILIIFEVVNRTIAALLSSSLGIAALALSGIRPTLAELVSWLDVETLLLLFSMMLLVAILADTGLFDYLAVLAYEVTGGRTWPLINCLCFFTAFFSTFLDNVTTVLLMTPVTIRLCEVMQLNPVHVMMAMVIFSNVGGAATPVGDPPNVIIASHPVVLRENLNFTTFTLHMGLGILLVCFQTYFQLRWMLRGKLRNTLPAELLELRQEITVWRRAAASLSSYSRDENIVRQALKNKVQKLNVALLKREAGKGLWRTESKFNVTLTEMKEKYRIRDKPLLIKSSICVGFVVVVFFLHAIPELQRLSLGWTALLGALLLLLLSERKDLEPVLARVEWSTLLFFAALFVLMEVLSKLGLISCIGKITESLILMVGEESRLSVALMLILWVSGLASAFVDNIPLTTMMVRVIADLADPAGLALPLAPLAWALSFGACLGGNGTLIGASANVVCAGVAEQHGYRFTFLEYLKLGFPIMLGNLLVSSVYLLLCHSVFSWH